MTTRLRCGWAHLQAAVAGLRRTASVANLMPAGARSISATHFSGLSLVRLNELTDSIVRAGSARWCVPQPLPSFSF